MMTEQPPRVSAETERCAPAERPAPPQQQKRFGEPAPRNFTGEQPGPGWKISDETQRELEAMEQGRPAPEGPQLSSEASEILDFVIDGKIGDDPAPPAVEREALRRIAEKAPDTRLSYTAKELDDFITACGTRPPPAVVDYTRSWHLASMNDGLFIIDKPPRPSTDDVCHERKDGPDLVLAVSFLKQTEAQAIVDSHNASLAASKASPAAAVVDYTERAAKANGCSIGWSHCGKWPPLADPVWCRCAEIAAALSAVASEHQAAHKQELQANDEAWVGIVAERDAEITDLRTRHDQSIRQWQRYSADCVRTAVDRAKKNERAAIMAVVEAARNLLTAYEAKCMELGETGFDIFPSVTYARSALAAFDAANPAGDAAMPTPPLPVIGKGADNDEC